MYCAMLGKGKLSQTKYTLQTYTALTQSRASLPSAVLSSSAAQTWKIRPEQSSLLGQVSGNTIGQNQPQINNREMRTCSTPLTSGI